MINESGEDELVVTKEMVSRMRRCSCEVCQSEAEYLEKILEKREKKQEGEI
jgi:hypothetical protein